MADYSIDTTVSGTVGSDVELAGLDDMRLTLDGGTTTTLAGGTTVSTTSEVTTRSDVSSDARITLAPLETTVDLRPVSVDSCVRVELAPPPPTEVCTPYEQRWGWSVLGLELFAVSVRGETSTHVRPGRARPHVVDL